MATYFTSSNNQRDSTPMIYLPGSYPEATILPGNVMTYMNSGSYADSLAGSSHQQNNYIVQAVEASGSSPQQQEILSIVGGSRIEEHDFSTWRDGRNEMLAMQSMGDASSILHGGQNLQGQGLSLSLGTQIPSGIQMPSMSYRNHHPGFASFLGPNSSVAGDGGDRIGSSRDEHPRSVEYLPHGFPAGNQDPNKEDLSQYGMMSIARTIPCSKYLKAAQQLLDEVVNVRKALNQPAKEKNQSVNENGMSKLKDSEGGSKNESSNPQESTNLPNELSHAERQELQNKLTKLLSMLDEVDRRYKQYYNQMQIVISSFDVIAGSGAAKPYTALALQTISRHFRCLRDAITGQIQAIRKSLGEQETSESSKGLGITRLRYVDQHLKQQRALHQLGMMQQHAWRPQRGLPESSVSILRAWLFEHFLHPYPKDSDKIMLARQTGLTRSQVSNWFINARVRLWKPMVEEMYKEETGDAELDSISSSENAAKQTTGDLRTSDDRREEMQKTESSMPAERCRTEHLMDSKSENAADVKLTGLISRSNFETGCREEDLTDYGLLSLREEQRPRVADSSVFPDAIVHSGVGGDRFMAAAAAYQMSDVGGFGSGNGVSLTLGLQHSEDGTIPISDTTHQGFVSMRGEDIFSASASSVGVESADFECINPENRQHRFNSSHILHDFVA